MEACFAHCLLLAAASPVTASRTAKKEEYLRYENSNAPTATGRGVGFLRK
jgi:hypothetical protein